MSKSTRKIFFFCILFGILGTPIAKAQLTSVYVLSTPENLNIESSYDVKITNTQNTSFYGQVIGNSYVYIHPSEGSILISPTIIESDLPFPPPSTLTGGTTTRISARGSSSGAKISLTQYPNPATTLVNVTITNGAAIGYELYDSMGIKKAQQEFATALNRYTINVETLQPGIYLQKINFGYNAYLTVQFIKQ